MTVEKKILHETFGKGGVRCYCCRPGNRKDRVRLARLAKRRARREASRENGT